MSLEVFTAWEPLLKSVSHQEKIARVAKLLENKSSEDITFTAINMDGTLEKFVLGSYEGNTKFLLGLVNPGFMVSAYHYVVIDPSLSDEDASAIYEAKGHPAIPGLWENMGFSPFVEGDQAVGKPLDGAELSPGIDETFTFRYNGQTYQADPEQQLISTNDHYFHWSLVKNTFFASQNPALVEKMAPFDAAEDVVHKSAYSDSISNLVYANKGRDWDSDVFPLVKSIFPKPGSLMRLEGENAETIYAVITQSSVELLNKSGDLVSLDGWGTEQHGINLCSEGNPSLIIGFASQYLGFDKADVELYA